ncbi:MAG TPA: helix-turn-helix domain-containing protein [Anaerolineales bacterium]|nr:helix-turn-helix domain-containing protein [Anaerolineales bacterium]
MPENLPDILTIQETSGYLRIPLRSLYKLAQEGNIPGQKVGRHWRFRRASIDRWLEENPFKKRLPETPEEDFDHA